MPMPSRSAPKPTTSLEAAFGAPAPDAALRPNAPFILVHHKGRQGSWEVVTDGFDVPHIVPVVQVIPLVPGAHVRTMEPGDTLEAALKPMMDSLARQGSVVLPASMGYLAEIDVQDPRTKQKGKYYMLWCERVTRSGLPDTLDTVEIDKAEWNRWRLSLFTDGLVPAPSDAVLEIMARRLRQRRSDLASVKEENRDDARRQTERREHAFNAAVRPWEVQPAPDAPPAESVDEVAALRAELERQRAATAAAEAKADAALKAKAAAEKKAKAAAEAKTPETPPAAQAVETPPAAPASEA